MDETRLKGSSPAAAYALLSLAALLWAANAVVSKAAVGLVSPQALTCLRWSIALTAIALVAGRETLRHWRVLRARWLMILLMGGFGYTAFNALFYVLPAIAIMLIHIPVIDRGSREKFALASIWSGVRFLFSEPIVLAMVMLDFLIVGVGYYCGVEYR